jgi:hypothetical protein
VREVIVDKLVGAWFDGGVVLGVGIKVCDGADAVYS